MRNALRLTGAAIVSLLAVSTAQAEPAMWVIKDADSTIYLLGTVHILRPETVWSSTKITDAVRESTELWLEVTDADDTAVVGGLVQKYGFDPKRPLSRRIPPKLKARLEKTAASYGFPAAALEAMKPWMAGITLTLLPLQKAGYDPDAGVEKLLRKQADEEGDKVMGLETMEQQMQMLDSIPERDQMAFLQETLEDVEEGLALLERMTKAWSEGDEEELANLFVSEMKREAPALYKRLLVDRNVRWGEQIAEMLNGSGVQMVAVGAGHVVGPESVQAQLHKRGIKAERH